MTTTRTQIRNGELAQGFKPRHVTMLSIAGVIGAGLFVGSGHAIAAAGPAAIVAYVLAGTLVVLVMRMLGEMAVASPDTGSFSTYADQAIGRWAGFTIGWLYWWFWVLVIPIEAIAAGVVLNNWFPQVESWFFALAMTVLLTLTNLFSVAKYGEFEFWFAMLKVIAIVLFIALGGVALAGGLPGREVSGLSQLMASNGGFMPNGWTAIIGALLTTMFSFLGTEAVTIAAAESGNPAKNIAKATRSVIWRICVFYLLSIFVIISVVPWNDPLLPVQGSYQRALEVMHIPYAKFLVDMVVLVAVASCLNSSIYISSRMIFSLAKRSDAPAFIRRTSAAGVPRAAVIASTVIGMLTTAVNFFAPAQVFAFLLASSGSIALLVYLVIAFSQLRMRSILQRRNAEIAFKMWLFPWLTWAVIGFIVFALGVMFVMPEHRLEVSSTLALAVVILLLGNLTARRHATAAARSGTVEQGA
ncbi:MULTISPECIES: GABA permease [unclassified Pseudomonas]|uniref:GABA permease n=1 Tax=unclassified Pseudomonas TaxID=196821 RepID=UPI0002A2BD70|nr:MULTISPECIES: GABA permease [unclassified Pseudomonas]MBB1610647.1 GABA permease [Pseudomonas sp. UMC76]MBB1641213.1 GABA permease [Pseudomonas sp. UME83]NTX92048.1 GABA permease [Pseudomonas sp. UMA643]NTY21935.1 GABA permease [Pseudomonas sp. UMC3103]NTY26527.1 GABA permease [Pseudomonas sp. UMA603]